MIGFHPPLRSALFTVLLALAVSACGGGNSDRAAEVVVIGDRNSAFVVGPRLPLAAQLMRSATVEGLVSFDDQGRVIPALADRWIVTDDGQSYIFRLRDGAWPDGGPITGETARQALQQALAGLRGTALGQDLASITEIRTMAGRVVEIRLSQAQPDLLQLLAQPELGLAHKGRGAGPMRMKRDGRLAILTPIAPEQRGLPQIEDWAKYARPVRLRALGVQSAIDRFDKGEADIVLGGRIEHFPRLDVAGLSRGAIRLDPVLGLFGLSVTHGDGFLSSAANREAIAMAIDRNALIAAFSVGGWTASTRIVAPGVEDDSGRNGERWTDLSSAERQGVARTRVTRWRADGRALSPLRIALPAGPGADVLFARLSTDLGAIGLQIRRVDEGTPADLRLVDQVARYPRTSWFLNQLSCAQSRALCHSPADTRAGQARSVADTASRRALLDEAEAELTAANVFIPFGSPIRWSLVSGDATGFATNRWGVHPLMPLAILPK